MRSRTAIAGCLALSASLIVAPPASAEDGTVPAASEPPRSQVAEEQRDALLGEGWRSSEDLMWTTSGDATGFHVLVARAADGYAWRTVASLSEPGFDTDMWIGNACLTESGERMVVSYAPRTFTNRPDLFDRGAFTAVVEVDGGEVRRLPAMSTLAYFSPGCGAGEDAVLTQGNTAADEAEGGPAQTRLTVVDAESATAAEPVVADGQVTSALPTDDGIVAVRGQSLVTVSGKGRVEPIAEAGSVPFRVAVDADGGLVYHEQAGDDRVSVRRVTPGAAPVTLAEGALGAVRAVPGVDGRVFLTGTPAQVSALPATVSTVDVPAGAQVSTLAESAVTETAWIGQEDPRVAVAEPDVPRAVRVTTTSLVTGAAMEFSVGPAAPAPDPGGTVGVTAADWVTRSPIDEDRWCSVPRNDRTFTVLQPKPRQVEWAINQAVRNSLYVQRPANWMGLGMAAYQPQQMFPPIALAGGGQVHSQVMLGIVAQESNMWQASNLASPGMRGNPLVGNFYGIDDTNDSEDDDWSIDWAEADCGYGVAQVTDGMRLQGHEKPGETARPWAHQQAIAADFAANIAAGLQILQSKWNQTRNAGMIVGEGRASGLENWYFALWAYNTGFYPESQKAQHNGAWGVGWANNPVNPRYPADRLPFMEYSYADAAKPQNWPYQEKVIGFAGHPLDYVENAQRDQYTYVSGFRPAWWLKTDYRVGAKAPNNLFCTASNDCYPGQQFDPPPGDDEPWLKSPCAHRDAAGDYDLKCWWHEPTTWKKDVYDAVSNSTQQTTGYELLRFDPGYAYQTDGTSFPPMCSTNVDPALPANALVVDDMPKNMPNGRSTCAPEFDDAGTFEFTMPTDSFGTHPAAADLHQLSSGFNSHFWFTHTRNGGHDYNGRMRMSGTWRFDDAMHGWGRVLVHIPAVAAHTQQAGYEIDLGGGFGAGEERVILQRTREHRWVSLGAFEFDGIPQIRLSNYTRDGTGEEDVAWDAVAIQPLPGKPAHQIVSLGDSLSSGEGASVDAKVDYYPETDFKLTVGNQELYQNACHRSRHAWSRQMPVPGRDVTVGAAADFRSTAVDHQLLACSGARTENVLPYHTVPSGQEKPVNAFGRDGSDGGGGNNSELTQLDRGFLNGDTTLVTISIGVNDARFSKVLQSCITAPHTSCDNVTMDGADAPNGVYLPQLIGEQVGPSIELVLRQIHARAPNATILLTGYPRLFDRSLASCPVREDSRQWLNLMADRLNARMHDAADTVASEHIPVRYLNPTGTFIGHGACNADQSAEWMHEVIPDRTHGELTKPGELDGASQQSFHPTIAGAGAYGRFVGGAFAVLEDGCRAVTCHGWKPELVGCTADAVGWATYDDFLPGGIRMSLYSSARCDAAWAEFEVLNSPGTHQSELRVRTYYDTGGGSESYAAEQGFEDFTGAYGTTPMVPVDADAMSSLVVRTCFAYVMHEGGELKEICDPQGV